MTNKSQNLDAGLGVETTVELIAGQHPNGETVLEKILVTLKPAPEAEDKSTSELAPQPEESHYQLLKSPVFVRGVATADVIQLLDSPRGAFKIVQHGGNLCVRVFGQQNLKSLEQELTAEIEKLGGDIEINEERVLVYSIHVSCGFNTIEKLLDEQLQAYPETSWIYGNVYDPETGDPLNWWQSIVSPQ